MNMHVTKYLHIHAGTCVTVAGTTCQLCLVIMRHTF